MRASARAPRSGSGKLWANKATIETNLVAALVQIETAIEMFTASGGGHLVLVSSVLGNKGVPGVKAAYAASKAGVSSLGESLRAEYLNGPIKVTTLEPGYIESEMTAKSGSTLLMVDNETGVKAMVDVMERESGRAAVPWWPWAPLVQLHAGSAGTVCAPFCLEFPYRFKCPAIVVAHLHDRKNDEVDASPVRGRCGSGDCCCAHRRCSAGATPAVREC